MILNELPDSEPPRGVCVPALPTASGMGLRTVPVTRSRAFPSEWSMLVVAR